MLTVEEIVSWNYGLGMSMLLNKPKSSRYKTHKSQLNVISGSYDLPHYLFLMWGGFF